jgi:O-antigen/teichoic acid export membrane protein
MDTLAVSASLLGMIMEFGTGSGVARFFYEEEGKRRQSLVAIGFLPVLLAFLLAGLISVLRVPISMQLYGVGDYADAVAVVAMALPASMLWGYSLLLWRLNQRPRRYVGLAVLHLLITVTASIYFVVVLRVGLIGVFWAQLLAYAICGPLSLFFLRPMLSWRLNWGQVRAALAYGAPIVPASLLRWAQRYADRFILLALVGVEQVGLYGFGMRVSSLLLFFTAPLELAWTPFALSIAGQPGHRESYARILCGYAAFASLGVTTLSLFAGDLVRLLAPATYWSARWVVGPLAGVVVMDTAFVLVAVGVMIAKKTPLNVVGFAVGTTVDLIGVILFAPRLGIPAAAAAWFVASVCSVTVIFAFSQRHYPIPYNLQSFALALALMVNAMIVGPVVDAIPWLGIRYGLKIALLSITGLVIWRWVLVCDLRSVVKKYFVVSWQRLCSRLVTE